MTGPLTLHGSPIGPPGSRAASRQSPLASQSERETSNNKPRHRDRRMELAVTCRSLGTGQLPYVPRVEHLNVLSASSRSVACRRASGERRLSTQPCTDSQGADGRSVEFVAVVIGNVPWRLRPAEREAGGGPAGGPSAGRRRRGPGKPAKHRSGGLAVCSRAGRPVVISGRPRA